MKRDGLDEIEREDIYSRFAQYDSDQQYVFGFMVLTLVAICAISFVIISRWH